MALWGASGIGILMGYRPPQRHTRYDQLSFRQKILSIDFAGGLLLLGGLVLILVGIGLGGSDYGWKSVRVYVTIPLGFALLFAFAMYEWKFTKTGLLHHDLFRGGRDEGGTFAVAIGLLFAEGMLLFAFILFYALMSVQIPSLHEMVAFCSSSTRTTAVFESDPFKAVARQMPFWVATGIATFLWAVVSIRLRRIREPLAVAFAIFAAALGAMASVQPGSSTAFIVYSGLAGIGFSGLIVLIITAVQLSVPHSYINTATSILVAARAIAASVASAVYVAIFSSRYKARLPAYVGKAAAMAGLPKSAIPIFVGDLAAGNVAALHSVPGVSPVIIAAGVAALKQAFLDSARVIFIIGAAIAGLSVVLTLLMGSQRDKMDYVVEAPVEQLHAKETYGEKQLEA